MAGPIVSPIGGYPRVPPSGHHYLVEDGPRSIVLPLVNRGRGQLRSPDPNNNNKTDVLLPNYLTDGAARLIN